MFPFESTQEIISITFLSSKVNFKNLVGLEIVNVFVFSFPLIAFTFLSNVYVLANPVSAFVVDITLPSSDPVIVKSITSNVSNIKSALLFDVTVIPAGNEDA